MTLQEERATRRPQRLGWGRRAGVWGLVAFLAAVVLVGSDFVGEGMLWVNVQGWLALVALLSSFVLLVIAARSASGPTRVVWISLATFVATTAVVGALAIVIVLSTFTA